MPFSKKIINAITPLAIAVTICAFNSKLASSNLRLPCGRALVTVLPGSTALFPQITDEYINFRRLVPSSQPAIVDKPSNIANRGPFRLRGQSTVPHAFRWSCLATSISLLLKLGSSIEKSLQGCHHYHEVRPETRAHCFPTPAPNLFVGFLPPPFSCRCLTPEL